MQYQTYKNGIYEEDFIIWWFSNLGVKIGNKEELYQYDNVSKALGILDAWTSSRASKVVKDNVTKYKNKLKNGVKLDKTEIDNIYGTISNIYPARKYRGLPVW